MTIDSSALTYVPSKDPKQAGWPGLRPSTTVVDGMVCERDVAVRLRDGVRISGREPHEGTRFAVEMFY